MATNHALLSHRKKFNSHLMGCYVRSITITLIAEQILPMIGAVDFDDIEPTEIMFSRNEQHKLIIG